MPRPQKPCQHCGQVRPLRSRQLCCPCWADPDILEQYPSTSKFAPKGAGNRGQNHAGELPATATTCLPGSLGKIAVMTERAARGESVFHPADAAMDLGTMPARLAG